MLRQFNKTSTREVFVLPTFEVEKGEEIPETKKQLQEMLQANRAVYFHQLICHHCQRFPGIDSWINDNNVDDDVKVLYLSHIKLVWRDNSWLVSNSKTVKVKFHWLNDYDVFCLVTNEWTSWSNCLCELLQSNCCLSINFLQPFTTVKRINELHRWEPFYIGTNEDPLFSEKLSWEGLQDKMTQVSLYQFL